MTVKKDYIDAEKTLKKTKILFNSKRIHSQIIVVNNALPAELDHLQMEKQVNLIRDSGIN